MSLTSSPSEKIYSTAAIREIERAAIEHGVAGATLMRRAGEAAFQYILARYAGAEKMTVLCGGGNNGGDGYVVAHCAQRIGIAVTVLSLAEPTGDGVAEECAAAYLSDGGERHFIGDDNGKPDTVTMATVTAADLIVDALFGIGLTRAPHGVAAELIRSVNAARCPRCPVVALDMPSGLHADTGHAFAPCVTADATVTFIGLKLGLLTGRGRECGGEIKVAALDISPDVTRAVQPCAQIISPPSLPRRARDMHKGDAGRIVVVGGARGMAGAGLLAGEAALRCGGGLVTVAGDAAHINLPALHCPELMSADALSCPPEVARADVTVLGPGLGRSAWGRQVFNAAMKNNFPMVLDADALHWLSEVSQKNPATDAARILTPHSGEAASLLQCTVADIEADRAAAAREIAARFAGVCVLKGAGTLVADGAQLFVCDKGNPGMATAGMGDVLAGIIGALCAQMSVMDAACAGVWIHAHAADCAVKRTGERGLLARDVIHELAPVIRELETVSAT